MKDIVIKIFVSDFELFQNHIVTHDSLHYGTPDTFTEGPRFIYPRLQKIDDQDYIQFLFIYREYFFYSTNLFDREVNIEPITFDAHDIPFRERDFELICKKLSKIFKCMVEMVLTSEDGAQTAYLYEDNKDLTNEYTFLESFEKSFISGYLSNNYDELYGLYQKYRARTFNINENIKVQQTLDKLI